MESARKQYLKRQCYKVMKPFDNVIPMMYSWSGNLTWRPTKGTSMAASTEANDSALIETVNRHGQQIAKLEASNVQMATKADVHLLKVDIEQLRTETEKLKADLTWRILIAMSVLTGIFVAIVRLPIGNG